MLRWSFVAGIAAALIMSAAGWSAVQSAPVQPAAADRTLGASWMHAIVADSGQLVRGSGVLSSALIGTGRL